MMNNSSTHDDPAAIERDIRRTQDDMSRTVDKLGDQLTARNLFNALLDKADENNVDARMLIDGARRNPVALGLIAAGAIWLVSDKDSKLPSMPSRNKSKDDGSDDFGSHGSDVHHQQYVAHMSAVEMREDEDPLVYQRRRDLHRASFLMCERKPDEDERSFRQRLDEMTDRFREKRRAWADSTSQSGTAAAQKAQRAAQQASSRAQELYTSNPLVGGMLAAALGAALASGLPVTRKEQEKLGGVGAKARQMADEQKEQLTSKLRDKKDELVEKADQKLQPEGQEQSQRQPGFGGSAQSSQQAASATAGQREERQSPSGEPFMMNPGRSV